MDVYFISTNDESPGVILGSLLVKLVVDVIVLSGSVFREYCLRKQRLLSKA